MPNLESKRELSRAEQLQVCLWFAELLQPADVQRRIKEQFGRELSLQAVCYYRTTRRWRRLTRFLRKRFMTNLLAIPIANKEIRLKRYESIYQLALTESLKSVNRYGEVYELKLGDAVQALNDARREIEGEKSTAQPVTIHNTVNVINTVDGLKQIAERRRTRLGAVAAPVLTGGNGHAAD